MSYIPPKIKQIKQILPATGWYFTFATSDGKQDKQRLVCWALCEPEGGQKDIVVGMIGSPVGEVIACHQLSDGRGYGYYPEEYARVGKGE